MFTKTACILLGLLVALGAMATADDHDGHNHEVGHHHADGHTHDDGHGHDKDVHSHNISFTDHCFSCDHQIYSQTGSLSSPLVWDELKLLTGQNEDCKTPGANTPSVPCKLQATQVCIFQLVDVNIRKKNVSGESYSVRLLSRRCIDAHADSKGCLTTDRDLLPWVGKSLKNIFNSGYEYDKTPRLCYCNSTSDCNGEVVSGASITIIQAVNMWSLVSLALAYLLLRPVVSAIKS